MGKYWNVLSNVYKNGKSTFRSETRNAVSVSFWGGTYHVHMLQFQS